MVEFDGNPFESSLPKVSISDIVPTGNKFPTWAWLIIVPVVLFIAYQIYKAFFPEKDEKDKK
jgi:hypothetical protein